MYIAPIISLLPGFVLLVLALVLAAAHKERPALVLLLLGAAALRVAMISLDPFLHDWDERFHACVAKNMMQHPFQPMLHATPLSIPDRLLGAGFGLLRGGVLLLALATAVSLTPAAQSKPWQRSEGARWIGVAMLGLKPLLPAEVARYLPN